jgi:hypothetical protein
VLYGTGFGVSVKLVTLMKIDLIEGHTKVCIGKHLSGVLHKV